MDDETGQQYLQDIARDILEAEPMWGFGPCGYFSECAVHCGRGPELGLCEPPDYDYYRELYATTGDQVAFVKMLDCVTME